MKIYIAASSRHDIGLAEQIRDELERRGHGVIDWMSAVRDMGPDPRYDGAAEDSLAQLQEIETCDVLIYVEPRDPYSTIGIYAEAACALAWRVPIVYAHDDDAPAVWPMAWLSSAAVARCARWLPADLIADVTEGAAQEAQRDGLALGGST